MSLPLLQLTSKPLNPLDLPAERIRGLYVHIPFCFHKCHYCDFYSITRQSEQRMAEFVDRILLEASMWTSGAKPVPATVFFGGGTPSLLPLEQMARLLRGLHKCFSFKSLREWTVEVNPATASEDYLRMLRDHGVDRISLGAQSFDRNELNTLERHHDPDDVPRSLDLARRAGFSRLNIDLIYAIPGQTLASWEASLEAAVKLGLSHYSCYGLTYEPNTAIAVRKRLGQFQAAEESLELSMFHHTRRRLSGIGCPPYEISNFASAGQECLHNLIYWTGGDYLGLGPSAASLISGCRFRNRPHLGEWERAVDAGELPATDVESLSPLELAGERMMLMLRLSRGVEFAEYAACTGLDAKSLYAEQIDQLAGLGLINVDDRGFRLSEAGLNVADAVAAEFLSPSPRAAPAPVLTPPT